MKDILQPCSCGYERPEVRTATATARLAPNRGAVEFNVWCRACDRGYGFMPTRALAIKLWNDMAAFRAEKDERESRRLFPQFACHNEDR